MNTRLSIRLDAHHDERARTNHGQDLKTLNARGGLEWDEIAAIVQNRNWQAMDSAAAMAVVLAYAT